SSQYSVRPPQIGRRVRVRQFYDAFVDRVGRTDTENKDRRDKRPEEPFFPVTEWMLAGSGPFVEAQTQQQKDLVGGVSHRVQSFGHHAGRAGHEGCYQLQYCDQTVGKERTDYGQHTRVLQVTRLKAPFGLSRKNPAQSISLQTRFVFELRGLRESKRRGA